VVTRIRKLPPQRSALSLNKRVIDIIQLMRESLEPTQAVNSPQTLQEGWTEFIERFEPYHWFVTLTFKDDLSNARANKIVARFMRGMNEDLFGKRYRDKGLGLPYINAREDRG